MGVVEHQTEEERSNILDKKDQNYFFEPSTLEDSHSLEDPDYMPTFIQQIILTTSDESWRHISCSQSNQPSNLQIGGINDPETEQSYLDSDHSPEDFPPNTDI